MDTKEQKDKDDKDEDPPRQHLYSHFQNFRLYNSDSDDSDEESDPPLVTKNVHTLHAEQRNNGAPYFTDNAGHALPNERSYVSNPFNYNDYSPSTETYLPNVYRSTVGTDGGYYPGEDDSDSDEIEDTGLSNMYHNQRRVENTGEDELDTFMRRHSVIGKISMSHALLTRTHLPQDVFSPREIGVAYPWPAGGGTLEALEEADMKKAIALSLEELEKNAKREEERLKEERLKEEIRKNYEEELLRKQKELELSDDSGEEDPQDDNFYYEEESNDEGEEAAGDASSE